MHPLYKLRTEYDNTLFFPTHNLDQRDKKCSHELFTFNMTSDPIDLQVLATGVVRKIIECFFHQKELRWLDDILPGAGKKESEKVFITDIPIHVYIFTHTPPTSPGIALRQKRGEAIKSP